MIPQSVKNSPLESAVSPGVDSVTSELTDDDWLSNGNLANRFLSTSVWKDRSPPGPRLALPP
jgi:hypothetical protein